MVGINSYCACMDSLPAPLRHNTWLTFLHFCRAGKKYQLKFVVLSHQPNSTLWVKCFGYFTVASISCIVAKAFDVKV